MSVEKLGQVEESETIQHEMIKPVTHRKLSTFLRKLTVAKYCNSKMETNDPANNSQILEGIP
jgi:hypothetical protein